MDTTAQTIVISVVGGLVTGVGLALFTLLLRMHAAVTELRTQYQHTREELAEVKRDLRELFNWRLLSSRAKTAKPDSNGDQP